MYAIHIHIRGKTYFKSLFRSQFDEIRHVQGGTVVDQVTIRNCKSNTGWTHLAAFDEGLWLPFKMADGITCNRNEQHIWKKQSWEVAGLVYNKELLWGVHRRQWGCFLSSKAGVSPTALIISVQDSTTSVVLGSRIKANQEFWWGQTTFKPYYGTKTGSTGRLTFQTI